MPYSYFKMNYVKVAEMDYSLNDREGLFDYAIIGAGFSGAYIAGQIAKSGKTVVLIDKARGTGGRMSSKRLSMDEHAVGFDLGAAFFEVTHADFEQYLCTRDDVSMSVAATGKLAYAVPRNSAIARGAVGAAETVFGARVLGASFRDGVWQLQLDRSGQEESLKARTCIVATPPKQAAQILGEEHALFPELDAVEHEAQWVAMLGLARGSAQAEALRSVSSSGVFQSKVIQSMILDHEKQGRSVDAQIEPFVVHLTPEWTRQNLDLKPEQVAKIIIEELASSISFSEQELAEAILMQHVHRWLYARPLKSYSLKGSYIARASENLLVCGDYFDVDSEYGLERAFLSARSLLSGEFSDV